MKLKDKLDKRKVILGLIAICIGSFVMGFSILAIQGESLVNEELIHKLTDISEEKEIGSIEGIESIEVNSSSYDLTIKPADGNVARVELTGKIRPENKINKLDIVVDKSDSRITIGAKMNNKFFIGSYNYDLNMIVYLPKEYTKDIIVDNSSSDVDIRDMNIRMLNIDLSSGDIEISRCLTEKSEIKVSSGDVSVYDLTGEARIKATSGEVDVVVAKIGDIDINTSSGDIDLTVPKKEAFNLNADVSSGDIELDIPITLKDKLEDNHISGYHISDDSNKNILLKATSGDIDIGY